jgi:tetratricopeptide (TPR) repeat protein/DNA-binding XRE family transcriptional regulator
MDALGFGDLLKTFRLRSKISQRNLAQVLGKHINTVGGWERGDFLPESRGVIVTLAQTLKLTDEETRQLLETSLITVTSHWYVPYHRNPFFTGQEEYLHQLAQRVGEGKAGGVTQAISGLGGIGKTSLALEFAYRYADHYYAVLWAQADTLDTLRAELVRFAAVLGLTERQEQDQKRSVEAVIRWLATHRGWLLILDNVETLEGFELLLPSRHQGTILFTTRLQVTEPFAPSIRLTSMNEGEGMALLLRRAKRLEQTDGLDQASSEDKTLARAIVREVDGLPLALDQAGAYILHTQCGLSGYLQLYHEQRHQLLSWRGQFFSTHPASVKTTFQLVFKQIEHINQSAAQVLQFCAFLAPEAIPEELFRDGGTHLNPPLQYAAVDTFSWNEVLEILQSLSLVHRDSNAQTLTIHRLVQATTLDTLSTFEQEAWRERVIVVLNTVFPEVGELSAKPCERLLSHVFVCEAYHLSKEQENLDLATLLFKAAWYLLLARAQFSTAERFFLRALHIAERILGPAHHNVAHPLYGLAYLYQLQDKDEQAEHLCLRALSIAEQALEPNHLEVTHPLNGLANIYAKQGKYELAESFYQRALRIREQNLHPEDHEYFRVASLLSNLAILYYEQRKYEQAEPLYQRSLTIRERLLGADHPDVAKSLSGLANVYREQGKYEQAEPLYQQALAIQERSLGLQHPDTAESLHDFATLSYAQGKREEALSFYQRAYATRKAALGAHHSQTIETRERYTALLQAMGGVTSVTLLESEQVQKAGDARDRVNL